MKQYRVYLPFAVIVSLIIAGIIHGSIPQPLEYHNFADKMVYRGIPHFVDVISNLGFALVAMWGLWELTPMRDHEELVYAWRGYRLFLFGLFLTALGSSYYHLAPDNFRLIWDRIPIALTCSGLLAGVAADTRKKDTSALAAILAIMSILSVLWWHISEICCGGDLRPYLLMQIAPLVLIPLWQWIYKSPARDRWGFGGALVLYLFAKVCEVYDYQLAGVLGEVSGHSLKHLLATAAAALIVFCLIKRVEGAGSMKARRNMRKTSKAALAVE